MSDMPLTEFIPGQIWIQEYPIRFAGCTFNARMTVVAIADRQLMLHSPCEIDDVTKAAIEALGQVVCIVAPGTYHHLYVTSAQAAFPDADTYICPGIERKRPEIQFDWLLGDRAPALWAETVDQALLRGNRIIWEVAMFHRPSRTLILTDLIENITDQTPNVNWLLKLWWKLVFRMWDNPKPAPEYQMGWTDKTAAKASLQTILEWDFDKIILAHGDVIESDAKTIAAKAWRGVLL